MSLQFPVVAEHVSVLGLCRRCLLKRPCLIQHQVIQQKHDAARSPDAVKAVQQPALVTEHHHRGVGVEAAVQEVARNVELVVKHQDPDCRVRFRHLFQQKRLHTAMVVSRDAVAADAAAHDVRIDLQVFPKADKYRLESLVA